MECSMAERLLGGGHPLATVLRSSQTAIEQVLAVAAVQAGDLSLLYEKAPFALSLAVAGCVVQVALGCRLGLLVSRRRDLCRELIIAGLEQLPLADIERASHRLRDARRRARFARSIREVADIAERGKAEPTPAFPLVRIRVLRAVAPELQEIAWQLLSDAAPVRGLARVDWLLTSGESPLYGAQIEPLRQELGRARYLLAQ
jgi:hypothetical protein